MSRLAWLALVFVACSNDSSFLIGSASNVSSGGSSGSIGGRAPDDGPPEPPVGVPNGEPKDAAPDRIACESSLDAGLDADAAGRADADIDGGPCALPAPRCRDDVTLLHYDFGECVAGYCRFEATEQACPGGCFRQFDGGLGCNR